MDTVQGDLWGSYGNVGNGFRNELNVDINSGALRLRAWNGKVPFVFRGSRNWE